MNGNETIQNDDNNELFDVVILVVSAIDGPMAQTREQLSQVKQAGANSVIVFLNKVDAADEEMIDLAKVETRELLDSYGFDGSKTPIVSGSALAAVKGSQDDIGMNRIIELIDSVNALLPESKRQLEKRYIGLNENSAINKTGNDEIKHQYENPGATVPMGILDLDREVRKLLDSFTPKTHKMKQQMTKITSGSKTLPGSESSPLSDANICSYDSDYMSDNNLTLEEARDLPEDPLEYWKSSFNALPKETREILPYPRIVIPVSAMNGEGVRDVAHSLRKIIMFHNRPMGTGLNR